MQGSLQSSSRWLARCSPAQRFSCETLTVIFDDLQPSSFATAFWPRAELESLSSRTQTPLYQIHSVASFYPHFHLVPPARAEVRVCPT